MLPNCADTHKKSVRSNFQKIVGNYSQCSCQPKQNFIVLCDPPVLLVVQNYQIGYDTSQSAQIFTGLSELQSCFRHF